MPIETNWKNVDLDRESHLAILDEYRFEQLLLEIECNLPEINEETVRAQFEHELRIRIDTARSIFRDNLKNVVAKAKAYREEA